MGKYNKWSRISKKNSKKRCIWFTTPLITLSSGAKMGKTEKGAVWLNKKNFLHMIIGNFGEIQKIVMFKNF